MEIKTLLLKWKVRRLVFKTKAKFARTFWSELFRSKKGEQKVIFKQLCLHSILIYIWKKNAQLLHPCLLLTFSVRLSWFLMTEEMGDHILITHQLIGSTLDSIVQNHIGHVMNVTQSSSSYRSKRTDYSDQGWKLTIIIRVKYWQ